MNENTDNALRISAWANDMCRALNERNKFWKWLFKVSLGKYAYREYVGMIYMLNRAEYHPEFEYALEHAAYHNKPEWEYWSVKVSVEPIEKPVEPIADLTYITKSPN